MSTSFGRYQVGATGRWTGNLKREDGARIGVANITDAKLWLYDPVSGENIRGSSGTPQSIWPSGTNNFQYADTTDSDGNLVTTIGWDVQLTDVALRNALLSREEHVAEITVNYTQSGTAKVLQHTHRLRCVDAPGLCTWDDVLLAIPELNEDTERVLVEDAIEAFGAVFEKRNLRKLRKSTVANPTTEVLSVRPHQRVLQLSRYPIDSVVRIEEDWDGVFTGVADYDAEEYYVEANAGQVVRRGIDWLSGDGNTQVVYVGGLFSDPAQVDMDLRWAAVQQVVHWWKNRDKLGVISMGVPGSSVTMFTQKLLLPQVAEVLRPYHRPHHW